MPVALLPAALFGLLIGSFLNVVAYRLPRGESLASPGSRCPGCGHAVRPYDNVPVLSWLALRGRCRDCGVAIAPRYALVEAGTAAAFAAVVVARHDDATAIVLGLVLVAFLVPLTLIDLDVRLLPNSLTAPAAVLAIALGFALDQGGEAERLIAGAAAGGFFLVAALAYPVGMGMGDVKLAAVLGLFLGREVAVALIVALVAGVIVGGMLMAAKGVAEGRKAAVPFGPFLASGAMVALLVGPQLVQSYLDHL